MSPLVLAENIYAVDMEDVDPTRGGKAVLNFENMVQATLLDLLDRGNLLLQGDAENPVLQIATYDGLADFERRFWAWLLTSNPKQKSKISFQPIKFQKIL